MVVADAVQQEDGGGQMRGVELKAEGARRRREGDVRLLGRESKWPEEGVPQDIAALPQVIDAADVAVALRMACAEISKYRLSSKSALN